MFIPGVLHSRVFPFLNDEGSAMMKTYFTLRGRMNIVQPGEKLRCSDEGSAQGSEARFGPFPQWTSKAKGALQFT
eukprot:5993319-Amphidinium_carterae.1